MQTIIKETIDHITVADPIDCHNLSMFPLLGHVTGKPWYLTLDAALKLGVIRIKEISQGGSVPELRVENQADQPVLLLDGEELVGAKQNRILNLTVLVPAKCTITIPVSCVEAGRWGYRSREFSTSECAHFAGGRASKAETVSENLSNYGEARSDQSEVWDSISAKSSRMQVSSPTGAMDDIFSQHRTPVEDYVRTLEARENQVGAIFAIDGTIMGTELFDHPDILRKLLNKIVSSYALDAVETAQRRQSRRPDRLAAEGLLRAIASAETQTFRATGLGEDVRMKAAGIVGGALVADDILVHLAAFRQPEGNGDRIDREPTDIFRTPRRHRH